MDIDLSGRKAFISGSTQGIGVFAPTPVFEIRVDGGYVDHILP